MKLILLISSLFLSVQVFAAEEVFQWKCHPRMEIVDAGFYVTITNPTDFPFAVVREMSIAGSKIIYKDYVYKVNPDDFANLELRDLATNGKELTLIINAGAPRENGHFDGEIKQEHRHLGMLGLLSCQKNNSTHHVNFN